MKVTRETLKTMTREFDLVPLTDEELDIVLPNVQAMVDGLKQLEGIDLSEVRVSHVFRADPRT